MSDPLIDAADDAATPLSPEERDGLIPSYIILRRELNEAEQIGIADADRWASSRKRNALDEGFLRRLHGRMFGGVWRWAGEYRRSERNIGVDHWRIETELRQLLDDVRYWIGQGSFTSDEIAARFHHRLTWIHPFPNGNGRFSRLTADLLAVQLGRERFTWGAGDLIGAAEVRRRYVAALRAADSHDYRPLMEFVRS